MKHPNPFYLGTLKKTLTERETDEMYNTIKWVWLISPLCVVGFLNHLVLNRITLWPVTDWRRVQRTPCFTTSWWRACRASSSLPLTEKRLSSAAPSTRSSYATSTTAASPYEPPSSRVCRPGWDGLRVSERARLLLRLEPDYSMTELRFSQKKAQHRIPL